MKKSLFAVCAFFLFAFTALATDAPFPPAFHGIRIGVLMDNLDYYPKQGLYPQTLSIYRLGERNFAAGSFDRLASADSRSQVNITESAFVDTFKAYGLEGYRPRDISVYDDTSGIPRFSVVWEKSAVPAAFWIDMSDAGFDAKCHEFVVEKGYRIAEHALYTDQVGNRPPRRKHVAVFVKDGKPFYFFHGLDQAAFRQKTSELEARGFVPSTLSLGTLTSGYSLSVIYLPKTAATATYIDMTSEGYQAEFTRRANSGYRLLKLVGYATGNIARYAAIWEKR